ncbi:hypothetical protein MBEHAL_0976 [Halarchaeum acidiphilum MH1-52-1]|uniref:DUF8048 domain-containing protein n=1 Tax=Halarchaeum acidiphilum MH1-52-1 TaxID=1261545 RepID=U2YEI2_9EURY|nr:hypothetical protein [Halarchaeum acidiphilum]GAD52216.1 hypothetical protein MBEHAL_0976 [Halarchaeum acidiphilum MH1-52-1]
MTSADLHPIPDAACRRIPLPFEAINALLARIADYFRGKERALGRQYERALDASDGVVLFADVDFWDRAGDALGFTDAETAAVQRAHETTLLLAGDREDRRAEFETALDVRTAVVLGR